MPPNGTTSSSAATPTGASSSRSGCASGTCWRAMNVNVWDMGADIQALIRDGGAAPVDRGRLADTSVPLAHLLPATARDA